MQLEFPLTKVFGLFVAKSSWLAKLDVTNQGETKYTVGRLGIGELPSLWSVIILLEQDHLLLRPLQRPSICRTKVNILYLVW